MTYKGLHELALLYICYTCVPTSSNPALQRNHSSDRGNLIVPRTQTVTFGCCAFAVAAPSIWNTILYVAVHHCRRSDLDSRHFYLERHIIFQIEYYDIMLFYVELTNFKPILTFCNVLSHKRVRARCISNIIKNNNKIIKS